MLLGTSEKSICFQRRRVLCRLPILNLRIPRPGIARRASTTLALRSVEISRQVLRRYLHQQLRLVPASQDLDLANGNLIQPRLDQSPNGREQIGSINDVKFAHALWVLILANEGCPAKIVLDIVEVAERDVFEVKDSA